MEMESPPIILNHRVFSPSFVPDKLPHRERELSNLTDALRDYLSEGGPTAALIRGRPGLGKTVVSLRAAREFSPGELTLVHVNCRKYPTAYAVFSMVVRQIGGSLPERGLSSHEMFRLLEEYLSEGPRPLMIILDEVSYLRDLDEVLYPLLRIHEGSSIPIPPFVLAIAREWQPDFLVDRTLREFFVIRMKFEPYTKEELFDIIRDRAEMGLAPGSYTPDILGMVAELASDLGDARRAIFLLYSCLLYTSPSPRDRG